MRAPDKSGVARAWRIEQSPEAIAAHEREWGYPPASIGPTWLVNGPYHPLWSWWYVGVVSLADRPGTPPARRRYPEAEYELMILSLNPSPTDGRPAVPDIDGLEAGGDAMRCLPGFLTPPDVVFQFDGVTDDQAAGLAEIAVDVIVGGQSCDSDFRQWWLGSLQATVQHIREGLHA